MYFVFYVNTSLFKYIYAINKLSLSLILILFIRKLFTWVLCYESSLKTRTSQKYESDVKQSSLINKTNLVV